ncbi:MAG: class I SAM-dependent methyltransferase [Oscillospiraceae bacterium]|nr:class I SAM-dependent methyltransferase [Oscillospiraceae bacterium]
MNYVPLAPLYDAFTRDVPYAALADFYDALLNPGGAPGRMYLDLCCGTGTLTWLLARRGREMIGVDASPEMLAVAQSKAQAGAQPEVPPLFLCQEAAQLDLYGTVQGALCSLDGMNYLPPEELPELLRRLHLFLEPGGVFAFDFHSPAHLRELDGGVFVDETPDALCLWRATFDPEEEALVYGMDIFTRAGRLWRREEEEHVEYAHAPETLRAALLEAGFTDVELLTDGPGSAQGRLFLRAVNLPH